MGKNGQEDTAGRRYSGSRDPEVGASGLMRSLLLSGWDPYIIGLWLKICVLLLLPEHHKFSDPESRLKAVFCTQVPLNYANIGSFSQETLNMLRVLPIQCFTDMTEDKSGQPFHVHAPLWAHWDGEWTRRSSTKLEAKAVGGNALDWELGDQDSTCWPTSKLGSKTLFESHVPSPLQTLDSELD